ncbi:MAG: M1 family metallopeptidase [Desulfatitalea sp.]|nr:M1 family metallopeptidase [Desulfatitalea sp.]NNK00063.1 M1 family metallopeptidase [Desulfatitalea sp.]
MTDLHPQRYRILITPDLDRHRFKGSVSIEMTAGRPVDRIHLNLLELAVWHCRLVNGRKWTELAFSTTPTDERLTIYLPGPQHGDLTLDIAYEGVINDQMAGFYRSQTVIDGQTHRLAVTQFQESSARRVLPCMDEPLHKAIFELTLTVPDHLAAIANTLPEKQVHPEPGLNQITFAPTPRMSTYLLFFGVGPFEITHDSQDRRVRLAHLPGQGHTTGLGLAFGRRALAFCEEYYGIAYPLPKMDLIAVPDFAFGAMENWGAITFRENLLLHFAESTSKAGVQRICEVIAHEIAHQWFGNLVTPSNWRYLWLNESFATYFGYGVVAHYHPEWEVWAQFLNGETATALTRDGLQETFAIEMPGGKAVAINASTAPIIYNKGGSILRMIEGFIGGDAYQEGVRGYLRQHQYQCAESRHLWEAFEAASAKPITAMMQTWIGQPGHPLVTVARQGDDLVLHQKRFTYLDADSDQTWDVPITLTAWDPDGQPSEMALMMRAPSATLSLPPGTAYYKLNNRQTGFYRVAYADTANFQALGRAISDQTLPDEDRWGVQNDLFALVRQGSRPLADYLDFLAHFDQEHAYLPLASIADHLFQAFLIASGQVQQRITDRGRRLVRQILDRIGCEPRDDDRQTTAILRDRLLWLGAVWDLDMAKDFGRARFRQLCSGAAVHPDIAKAVMQIGARTDGEAALTWLCERFGRSENEHERMNILAALGAFTDEALMERALAFSLTQVPPRNRFFPIVAAAANPLMQKSLWTWYQSRLSELETMHPLLYERIITAIVPYGGLGREDEVRTFGEAYMEQHPHITDAMRLALENLRINARAQRAWG